MAGMAGMAGMRHGPGGFGHPASARLSWRTPNREKRQQGARTGSLFSRPSRASSSFLHVVPGGGWQVQEEETARESG